MRAPILAPIVAMAFSPRALRPCLVLTVVGIALPLGPWPTSPAPALTGRCTAVLLIRDLRTRSERPAAARTPPPLHGRSLRPGKPERSASNPCLQTRRQGSCHRLSAHRPFDWRAHHKSDRPTQTAGPVGPSRGLLPGSIPISVKALTGLESDKREELIEWIKSPQEGTPPASARRGEQIEIRWRNADGRLDDKVSKGE